MAVRLTPRAARTGVNGIFAPEGGEPALKVRVTAAPVDGAANAALLAYLAQALQVRKSDLTLASGETSRIKIVHISGCIEQITARLLTLI